MYDLIIEHGEVFDFETLQSRQETLYIANGRIRPAPEPGAKTEAVQRIDATGKFVLPGFIDEHAHVNYGGSNIGANADILCPPSGVTTVVDGGTAGYANFDLFHRGNITGAVTRILAYLHVSPYGVHSSCLHEENHDPVDFNEPRIIEMFEKYPERLRGLKVRVSKATTSGMGFAPVRRAIEISEKITASGLHCPVAVHYADAPEDAPLSEFLDILRTGDIVAHVFQNHGETIFDERMRIKDCVRRAREKGVLFDNCHGRIHWSLANLRAAVREDFLPDVISSDVIRESVCIYPGFSVLHAMNACYACGMKLPDIFKMVTVNPARALGKSGELGALTPGGEADVTVVDIMPCKKRIYDRYGGETTMEELIVPLMTVRKGEIIFRQMFF